MLSKIIFVLTFFYVVKAGILTFNNENDKAEENGIVNSPSRACTASLCSQLCHQLGFQSGVCISSTICHCSGRRALLDGNQQENSDNYDGKEFEIDLGNESEVQGDNKNDIADVENDETAPQSESACTAAICYQLCRQLGFQQGVCISATVCRCSRRLVQSQNEALEETEDYVAAVAIPEPSVRSCTASICTQLCRQLGFQTGVCISPTICRCSGRRALTDDNGEIKAIDDGRDIEFDVVNDTPVLEDVINDVEKVSDVGVEDAQLSTRSCTASLCSQLCRQLGFLNGVCISPTVCRCSGRRALTDA